MYIPFFVLKNRALLHVERLDEAQAANEEKFGYN